MVDPVIDEMLAQFVVDSHYKSQPKGANFDDRSVNNSQDDIQASAGQTDPEVLILIYCYHQSSPNTLFWFWFGIIHLFLQIISQELLKKYLTYAKLNVFPRLHDADLDKLTQVYAELRRESSVR